MRMEVVLSIVGAFGVIALGVNGFFLRGIFQDMNEIKVQMAVIMGRHDAETEKLAKLETDLKSVWVAIEDMKERFHKLGNKLNIIELNRFDIEELKRGDR